MVDRAGSSRGGGERRFLQGAFVDVGFPLPEGEVRLLANVVVDGTTLRLWDVDVAPSGGARLTLGVRGIRVVLARLCALASIEGFDRIVLTGFRVGGAHPGRETEWVVRCQERPGAAD